MALTWQEFLAEAENSIMWAEVMLKDRIPMFQGHLERAKLYLELAKAKKRFEKEDKCLSK